MKRLLHVLHEAAVAIFFLASIFVLVFKFVQP